MIKLKLTKKSGKVELFYIPTTELIKISRGEHDTTIDIGERYSINCKDSIIELEKIIDKELGK